MLSMFYQFSKMQNSREYFILKILHILQVMTISNIIKPNIIKLYNYF